MGTLFRKKGSKRWQMGVNVGGRQICKSTHTANKSLAKKLLARWETEVFEGRFYLPRSTPPLFEEWADEFLSKVAHPNTRRRYTSSVRNLKRAFAGLRLSSLSAEAIERYKEDRLLESVEPATINHDLRVLRRILRLAERRQYIVRNPFVQVEFLKQRDPHPPYILSFEEEERILRVAVPYICVLVVLILETGMRSHREALGLRWDAIDFVSDIIRVRESKTRAGIRSIPLSSRCKNTLLRWREIIGPELSPFVFPNLRTPNKPMKDVRHAWSKALKDAGLDYFWIYNLRHTFASRLSFAGVPDLHVAEMIGHTSTSILQKYSKAVDEYRRDAVRRLEDLRARHTLSEPRMNSETRRSSIN
jgi:integrase